MHCAFMLIRVFPSDKIHVGWHLSRSLSLFSPAFLPGAQFFHRFSMLSLPPHALNLLPQSVVWIKLRLERAMMRGGQLHLSPRR